jgi:hypothetical protein
MSTIKFKYWTENKNHLKIQGDSGVVIDVVGETQIQKTKKFLLLAEATEIEKREQNVSEQSWDKFLKLQF